MSSERCQHPNRVKGRVELEFMRPDAAAGPVYTGAVSMAVCEKCGHVELYALFQEELCAWLKKS
jgi:hypothetical protein